MRTLAVSLLALLSASAGGVIFESSTDAAPAEFAGGIRFCAFDARAALW